MNEHTIPQLNTVAISSSQTSPFEEPQTENKQCQDQVPSQQSNPADAALDQKGGPTKLIT
jgi:hypothetical protein